MRLLRTCVRYCLASSEPLSPALRCAPVALYLCAGTGKKIIGSQEATVKTLAGIKLNVNGTIEAVAITSSDELDLLDAISTELDTDWFDVNDSIPGVMICIKDDGADTDQINPELTRLAREAGFGGTLHGPGIFLGTGETLGELTSLSHEQLASIVISWANRAANAARYAHH